MGGTQSLLDENVWDLADGALKSCEQTVDGAEPTSSYETYHLLKKSVVANQREFDVTDSQSNLLFHIRPSPGTIAGFDVLGIGSANADDFVLRVTVDISRRFWIVYRFDNPVFDGQKPDPVATEKFAIEKQTDRKELAARISASLAMQSFSNNGPDPADLVRPPIVPKHLLYKVCCVTVSWSRYMAVASYFGPPTVEQLFHSTINKEALRQAASEDSDCDFLSKAAKIAERMRERRSLADDLVDESEMSTTAECANGVGAFHPPSSTYTETNDAPVASQDSNSALQSPPIERKADDPVPAQERSLADDMEDESETEADDLNVAAIKELSVRDVIVEAGISPSIQLSVPMPESPPDCTVSPKTMLQSWLQEKTRSLQQTSRSLHEKSKAILRASSNDEMNASTANSGGGISTFLGISSKIEEDPLQGVIHLDKPLLLCQEIYTRIIGNHQTSRVSKAKVLTLLRQDMEQHLQDVNENETGVENGSPVGVGQVEVERSALGAFGTCEVIGNGPSVTAVVVARNSADSPPSVDCEMAAEGDGAAPASTTEIVAEVDGNNSASRSLEIPPAKPSELTIAASSDSAPVESKVGQRIASSSGFGTVESKEQPLVGYWAWENSMRSHKMKMHLAKGADLALHVVLAVLVNQVRYERNALAIAV